MAAATMAPFVSNCMGSGRLQRAATGRASVNPVAFSRSAGYGYGRRPRCAPKGACAPAGGFSFGCGPSGFTGRPLTQSDIEKMTRDAEQFWFSGKIPESWGSKNWNADTSASQKEADMPLAVDVQEEADAFVFTADVPGVARSDVKVQARREERELVISGQRTAPERLEAQKEYRRRIERRFGKFSRTFTLPDNSQLTGITAKFDNGVLIVTVPKTIPKEPEVTDIPINAGDDTSIPPIDV